MNGTTICIISTTNKSPTVYKDILTFEETGAILKNKKRDFILKPKIWAANYPVVLLVFVYRAYTHQILRLFIYLI